MKELGEVRSSGIGHPDPIGMSAGVLVFFYAAYSVYRYRREANRIISLFEANTQIKEQSTTKLYAVWCLINKSS